MIGEADTPPSALPTFIHSKSFHPSEGVIARAVGEETVLVNMDDEQYYSLDPVGSLIWEALSEGRTLGDVARDLVERFEIDQAVAETDVGDLVAELSAAGLVVADGP